MITLLFVCFFPQFYLFSMRCVVSKYAISSLQNFFLCKNIISAFVFAIIVIFLVLVMHTENCSYFKTYTVIRTLTYSFNKSCYLKTKFSTTKTYNKATKHQCSARGPFTWSPMQTTPVQHIWKGSTAYSERFT
jgi:hypothetical protein